MREMIFQRAIRLSLDDKLVALRELDHFRFWQTLDDRRYCKHCHRTITGRQVDVRVIPRSRGALLAHCPTENCASTPADWVYADPVAAALSIGSRVEVVA